MRKNCFPPCVAALLAVLAALQIASMRRDSQTNDEGVELTEGIVYLKTGKIPPQHPPLAKVLNTLPLLGMGLRLPPVPEKYPDITDTAAVDVHRMSAEYLYKNTAPADAILFRARLVTVAFTVLLGLALALWCRAQFGPAAALFTLFLYAFDPNFIAYGRIANTDVLSALLSFLCIVAWGRFVERRTPAALWTSGALLGLALTAKQTAVFLPPVMLAMYGVRWWQERGRPAAGKGLSPAHLVRGAAAVAAISFGILWASYSFEARPLAASSVFGKHFHSAPAQPHRFVGKYLGRFFDPDTAVGRAGLWAAGNIPVPALTWAEAFYLTAAWSSKGHATNYLLGEVRQNGGWRHFYLVAAAVKTPSAILLLGLLCAGISAWRAWSRRGPKTMAARLREAPFVWCVLLAFPVFFLGLVLTSNANIGIRYLLPVYPFLYAAAGAVLFACRPTLWRNAAAAGICLLLAAETVSVHPHYLAFFNRLSGGPERGADYLLDSNLDWGQDLRRLKDYLDANGSPEVCLSYFGRADADYYGIRHREIPPRADAADTDCVIAISASSLHLRDREQYGWLRSLKPAAHVGYSILIYDVRRKRS